MTLAIGATTLGKRYQLMQDPAQARVPGRIGPPHTLVEEIAGSATSLLRRLRGLEPRPRKHEFWALRDVNFEVQPGELVGLVGLNGSGKSTLLKLLSRVTEPTEGSIRLSGRIASLLEVGTGFHPDLSARQNIFLNGAILGMSRKEISARLDQIVAFAGIEQFLGEPVKHFSTGMYMRLGFAVAAHLESEILLVDEVLAVGDAAFQEKCLGTMRDAANSGRTVIFVSHNMSAISQLTRRTLILDAGRVVFDGPTPAAVRHYLHELRQQASCGRQPTDRIHCLRRFRKGEDFLIREMGMPADQPQDISPGGSVRLELLVDARSASDGLRILYCVNSAAGQSVLTGLTPPFSVVPGMQLIEISIRDLDLVPGEYDFSISLGRGGWDEMKLEYDAYMGFGRLAVSGTRADGAAFGAWARDWGPVYHKASGIRPLPGGH